MQIILHGEKEEKVVFYMSQFLQTDRLVTDENGSSFHFLESSIRRWDKLERVGEKRIDEEKAFSYSSLARFSFS